MWILQSNIFQVERVIDLDAMITFQTDVHQTNEIADVIIMSFWY